MDRVDAVEPTGRQKVDLSMSQDISFISASTHKLTPSLYAVCVAAGQEVP